MGLIEQLRSGSVFTRGTTTLSTGTGQTTVFGSSYILLGVDRTGTSSPCRIRLYGDAGSLTIDAGRPTSSFNYSASVSLNLDAYFSENTQSITFNPPIIATTHQDSTTWYNIESPGTDNVTVKYYPIEYNTGSRVWYPMPPTGPVTLTAGQRVSGSVPTAKSFIILLAESSRADVRLRLYSRPVSQVPLSEQTRPYSVPYADGVHLIADMLFDSASYEYKVSPVLQAYNLETYMVGNNRVGYILENLSGTTLSTVIIGMNVYPIED